MKIYGFVFNNQLHAVSRTQQDRQREPSIKTPERRNENINVNKYFISSSGCRTYNQPILQSHFGPLWYDWPHHIWCLYDKKNLMVNKYTKSYIFISVFLTWKMLLVKQKFLVLTMSKKTIEWQHSTSNIYNRFYRDYDRKYKKK